MFEVGFTEILLICAIALMVLGPARLPKLVADLGRWAGRARSMARQLRTQLEQEAHYDPLKEQPSQTIHTPAPQATATAMAAATAGPVATAQATPDSAVAVPTAAQPAAAPDRTDESRPG
jgi:sec-independent protein translocase protein TatB